MNEEAEKLLMMLIADTYSASGKVSKKSSLAVMRFVAKDSDLQTKVNNGCKTQISNHRLSIY